MCLQSTLLVKNVERHHDRLAFFEWFPCKKSDEVVSSSTMLDSSRPRTRFDRRLVVEIKEHPGPFSSREAFVSSSSFSGINSDDQAPRSNP